MENSSENTGASLSPVEYTCDALTEDLLLEMHPLFEAHYQEIAPYKDILLKVNRKRYVEMQELDLVRAFLARDSETGEILGYCIFTVQHSLNYMDSLQAVSNVIYIKKERRGFGLEFISWCDSYLKQEGVDCVVHRFKADRDFGPALKTLGYRKMDVTYVRRLQSGMEAV